MSFTNIHPISFICFFFTKKKKVLTDLKIKCLKASLNREKKNLGS